MNYFRRDMLFNGGIVVLGLIIFGAFLLELQSHTSQSVFKVLFWYALLAPVAVVTYAFFTLLRASNRKEYGSAVLGVALGLVPIVLLWLGLLLPFFGAMASP